jgi:hypothetical protein
MRPKNPHQSRARRWGRYLKIAGEAGTIAMSLRDKPTPLDWLGVGLRAVGIALNVREWTEVPDEYRRLVLEHIGDSEVDDAYWDGDQDSPFICRGTIDGEVFAWIGEANAILDGPYVMTTRQVESYRALGQRLWRRFGSQNLLYGSTGLATDPFVDTGVIATNQMADLAVRMRGFLDAGEARSYLLGGPPGTGKSVAIRWLIAKLELTSVRIDMSVFARIHGSNSSSLATSLETLLRLLRPQVMILDDLDRVTITASLLAFLELARRTCSVVIASANSVSAMMGAAVRPGRFDDIIRIDRLDPIVLRSLIPGDLDLHDRLCALPAAYVVEFAKRRRVLGRERALVELDELINRAKLINGAGDSDPAD